MTSSPKILIVGGVAGGASAATRARRMNERARIIMLEKDAYVSFANCGLPYHLGGVIQDRAKLLVAKPEMFKKRFNIEVRVRHEALAIDRTFWTDGSWVRMRSMSSMLRSVWTPAARTPGTSGRSGAAPGARINLS
jgi:flavin-dependent dehydrogenase